MTAQHTVVPKHVAVSKHPTVVRKCVPKLNMNGAIIDTVHYLSLRVSVY